MGLQKCGLNLNKGSKELQPHGTPQFPCAGYSSNHTERQEDCIPWHWHEEIEIIYIEKGQMRIKVPSQSFLLETGDCMVINSNILHYGAAVTECQLHSLVFHASLVFGNKDSVFAEKYVRPLLSCNSFSGYFIKAGSGEEVARWFVRAHKALAEEQYGFEFIVRENLSRICLFLHERLVPQADSKRPALNQDNLRVGKMLAYIHKNYAEDLSLAEIADKVGISERECLRCFQKTIQLSPIQYLLKYRVMQGAEMLIKNPTDSISDIATLCGFDSPSNFAKIFKRFYNCTPREYRKQYKEQD